jgi:hypothetical protein
MVRGHWIRYLRHIDQIKPISLLITDLRSVNYAQTPLFHEITDSMSASILFVILNRGRRLTCVLMLLRADGASG